MYIFIATRSLVEYFAILRKYQILTERRKKGSPACGAEIGCRSQVLWQVFSFSLAADIIR